MDTYQWTAHFADEPPLDEFDADGGDHGFAEIGARSVLALALSPMLAGRPHLTVAIPPDAQPVFFRRRMVPINLNTGEPSGPTVTTHVLGYRRGPVRLALWIAEDGTHLLREEDGETIQFQYPLATDATTVLLHPARALQIVIQVYADGSLALHEAPLDRGVVPEAA